MGRAYNLLSKQASKQASKQLNCALFYPVIPFHISELAEPAKRHGRSPCLFVGSFYAEGEKNWIKDT